MEVNSKFISINEAPVSDQGKKHRKLFIIIIPIIIVALLAAVIVMALQLKDYHDGSNATYRFGSFGGDDIKSVGKFRVLYDPNMNNLEFAQLAAADYYDIVIFTRAQADAFGGDEAVFALAEKPYQLFVIENSVDTIDAVRNEQGMLSDNEKHADSKYYFGLSKLPNGGDIKVDYEVALDGGKDYSTEMRNMLTSLQISSEWGHQVLNFADFPYIEPAN